MDLSAPRMNSRTRTAAGVADVPLLRVQDLTVEFATRRGTVQAVQHIDISVAKGETLGIVGEFGLGQVGDVLRGHAHS